MGNCYAAPAAPAISHSIFGGTAGQVCNRLRFGYVIGVVLILIGFAIILIGNRGKKSNK
jgi:hypothetical protein